MAQTFKPAAALSVTLALVGAVGPGPASAVTIPPSAVGKSDPAKVREEVRSLSLKLAATAKAAGVPNPKMDDKALKAHIEEALLGFLGQAGVDPSVGAAALRLALGDHELTGLEVDAIRDLLRKLAMIAGIEPGALGTGVDLIPPPPGGMAGGGSGYRTQ